MISSFRGRYIYITLNKDKNIDYVFGKGGWGWEEPEECNVHPIPYKDPPER
jgi:hypothetical protein